MAICSKQKKGGDGRLCIKMIEGIEPTAPELFSGVIPLNYIEVSQFLSANGNCAYKYLKLIVYLNSFGFAAGKEPFTFKKVVNSFISKSASLTCLSFTCPSNSTKNPYAATFLSGKEVMQFKLIPLLPKTYVITSIQKYLIKPTIKLRLYVVVQT